MSGVNAVDGAIALYRKRVTNPSAWQDSARELLWSANKLRTVVERWAPRGFARRRSLSKKEILAARHHSMRPAILLYAYAVENLLKALLVAKGVDPVGGSGRLKKTFAQHRFRDLARDAGVKGVDTVLLDQLTDFAYSGKYPVGIDPGASNPRSHFPPGMLLGIDALLPVLEQAIADTAHPALRPGTNLARLGRRAR